MSAAGSITTSPSRVWHTSRSSSMHTIGPPGRGAAVVGVGGDDVVVTVAVVGQRAAQQHGTDDQRHCGDYRQHPVAHEAAA